VPPARPASRWSEFTASSRLWPRSSARHASSQRASRSALYERAGELTKQLDRYAYSPTVRFSDAEVDQARAAGVTIEFERGWPLIVDRALYRELAKQAIARTVGELEAKVAQRAAEKKTSRSRADESADPLAVARSEHQRALRDLGEQAHGSNLDLGASLLTGLSYVDPADITTFI
jgi:hypothetical protein